MPKFDLDEFHRFTKALRFDSKERGNITLGDNLIGSQHRLLEQMVSGMEEGVHEFVVLKSRQLGCSTLSLAFDLYWPFKYRGMSGALVTHQESARDQFRTILQLYQLGLPEEWRRDIVTDSRTQVVWSNGSKLALPVAGTTKKVGGSKLGRSGALTMAHMTEAAFYGDPSGIDSLRASFAEHNPLRFYLWESTANGFNHYHEMWQEAKKAVTMKAIFVSWWSNEFNRVQVGDEVYQTYWGNKGRMTSDERDWVREVKLLYGHDIDAGQLAWYRYMANEKFNDEMMLAQEYPPTEGRAFVATGSAFFRAMTLTKATKKAQLSDGVQHLRVETGRNFWDTKIIPAKAKQATLQVWEEPVADAQYVIGCDPAYASSDTANLSAVSVWRCWYNRIEQVAEFASREIPTHAVAWIVAYLAGYYGRTTVNIEANGPGQRVLEEMTNLRRQAASSWEGDKGEAMQNVVRNIRQYIYRRSDSMTGPSSFYHTKTSYEVKERMMNGLRDYQEREMLVVRSMAMLEEMKSVIREGGSAPAAPEGSNDDRTVAGALAVMCWNDQMRQDLLGRRLIWTEHAPDAVQGASTPTERVIQNYMVKSGLMPALPGVPEPKRMVARGRVRKPGDMPFGMTMRRAEKVTI